VLYLDCFSGAAGDMILGSLIDAGVPLEEVRRALGTLAIDSDTVWTERVNRAGITATKFCVRGEDDGAGGHPHRHVKGIYKLIDGSGLSDAGKTRAKELFARLAEAEAAIHGTDLEKVHLHEVGALDSIVDIVGCVFALEWLAVDEIVASPLNVGSGTVRIAHGTYPVPAPATLRLLQEAPIYSGGQQAELVTPTGALLVSSYATRYGPMPPMRVNRIGYGAGSRDFKDAPNVVRVILGQAERRVDRSHDETRQMAGIVSAQRGGGSETVVVVECEIDDMNPQIFGFLMDRLLAEGALDVFYTPVQMKKNRPGTLLTVIAPPEHRERLAAVVFTETTTIGLRYREMTRECLERETVVVETAVGSVRVKVARRDGQVVNTSPEFDDCVRLAERAGVPVKEVQALATSAYLEQHSRSAEPETRDQRPETT
jgi:pyridinium-3,5-bisthiocarboxylic acid mononucleotide nickel chelatase